MDNPWRSRPTQGNICPTCSISHWPLCPPRPGFHLNSRFQEHNDHFVQRPYFEPFTDHRGSTASFPPPFLGNPNDRFGDPSQWHWNPSLERQSVGQFHGQSQIGDPGMVGGVHADGFGPRGYDYGGAGYKRLRVDDTGAGTHDYFTDLPKYLTDDQRRLKLIREHGGTGSVTGFSDKYKVSNQENSVFGTNIGNIDHAEHVKYHSFLGSGNDNIPEHPKNVEVDSFQDLGFGIPDRKEIFPHSNPGFKLHNNREDHGCASAPQYKQSNRKEDPGQLHYKSSLNDSLQINGHSHKGLPIKGSHDLGGLVEDVDFYHEGGSRFKLNLGDGYSSTVGKSDLSLQSHMSQYQNSTMEVHSDDSYRNNVHQGHYVDSLSVKKTQHPHSTNWQGSDAPYHEQRSNLVTENHNLNNQISQPYSLQHPIASEYDLWFTGQLTRQPPEVNIPSQDGYQGPLGHTNYSGVSRQGSLNLNKHGDYSSNPYAQSVGPRDIGPFEALLDFDTQPPLPTSPPPLPTSPPPPLPANLRHHPLSEPQASFSSKATSSTLFPISLNSSASHPPVPDHSLAQAFDHNNSHFRASAGFATEEARSIPRISSKKILGDGQHFSSTHTSLDKPKVVDASHIFKQPHRAQRPDHIVIILRGLPGSGKSHLAKMLRDLEVDSGGDAPRIHSMDDYFMTEVEKVEENEVSKSSTSGRGKKPVKKKVMEYCYEPDMEEAYRSSMLKAFKKTLEEGIFSFIIVDDRNLRVADFAQFWATAKRSGYEVYLLEASYKDPAGCAARNVHGFTQDDIERMAAHWEEAPPLYLKLDVKPLFHGDDLKESEIQEVDMDMDDEGSDGGLPGMEERNSGKTIPSGGESAPAGYIQDAKKWDEAETEHRSEANELGKSKWSSADFDEDDTQRTEASKGNLTSLSGLIQSYGKEGKSVHWGDQVGNDNCTGFSIGAAKKAVTMMMSLVIGPGSGYNSNSNPLSGDVNLTTTSGSSGESKVRNTFQEQLRAERESFKAVFDNKRRHRIGGLAAVEDE